MNVNDAISDYLMDIGHLDKRTVEDYRQRLTVFADWCDQEHVELEQVNNRMVQAFLTWLPAHHHPQKHGKLTLSTAALYGYTLYIKVFLSWCLQDEEYSQYTTLARVKGVRMPHKEKRLKHIFTDDEIAFEAAKHPSKTHEYQLRDLAITEGPDGQVEYRKAECGETRPLRLERGKGCKALPIAIIFEYMKGNILLFEKYVSWLPRPPLAYLAFSGVRPGQGFSNISLCFEC